MDVADFDFELPAAAIAAAPAEPRDHSRLLVLDRGGEPLRHASFRDLPEFLRPGDLLVLNDTRVRPWRLLGRRASGGRVECLILRLDGDRAEGFVKPSKKLAVGDELAMEEGAVRLRLRADLGAGRWGFTLTAGDPGEPLEQALERVGRAPLPPYIPRDEGSAKGPDRERYQTVFARAPGAVAAPTAGLHFTPALLDAVRARGVEITTVTLHVGEGTFAPVRAVQVEAHRMHGERYEVPPAAAAAVAAARARGGRVIAVGTTSCRTLETCADGAGGVASGSGTSELFLFPGKRFRVVDALITNFHLPRSTLLMLVSAFAGREPVLAAYAEAIAHGYRFYSYGDAMLIV
ncbi:MAG: tRNA preQ1(34) S-adenosylmethionine ribosyltransferase-isomerase QueA [Planctomycetota bacterium]